MRKITLITILFVSLSSYLFAQSSQVPTTLYEWNLANTGSSPGERIVATINSGTIGTYTGAAVVGQIIDGNGNWGYTLPIVANFKLFVNFTNSVYSLQQDVITPGVTLELKSLSATQVAIVANCPVANRQLRILLRHTTGNTSPITLGDPTVVTTAGTMLKSQPIYGNTLSGRLAINVTDNTKASDYTLAVGGKAIAEAVTVQLQAAWPDYVFKKDYMLPPLSEVKAFVDQNQHLPEIPSAQEIAKDGQDLGEMNRLLLKKVEELTLYLIALKAEVNQLQKQINSSTKSN